jgi:hypothetical protein
MPILRCRDEHGVAPHDRRAPSLHGGRHTFDIRIEERQIAQTVEEDDLRLSAFVLGRGLRQTQKIEVRRLGLQAPADPENAHRRSVIAQNSKTRGPGECPKPRAFSSQQ